MLQLLHIIRDNIFNDESPLLFATAADLSVGRRIIMSGATNGAYVANFLTGNHVTAEDQQLITEAIGRALTFGNAAKNFAQRYMSDENPPSISR